MFSEVLEGKKESILPFTSFPFLDSSWVEFLSPYPSHPWEHIPQGYGLPGAPLRITGSCMTWIGRIWKGMFRHIAGICRAVGIWKQTVGSSSSFINHCKYGRWFLCSYPREVGAVVCREKSSSSTVLIQESKLLPWYLDG